MTSEEILKLLSTYSLEQWEVILDVDDPCDILEALEECPMVSCEEIDHRRWWIDIFCVVEVNNILIGYNSAKTTGDESPMDKGWEFDVTSLCEVQEYNETITITKYKRKVL